MKSRVFIVLACLVLFSLFAGFMTPVAAVPPASPLYETSTVIHIVRFGETLSYIARWYGVSMSAIIAANGIVNPNRIYVGQRLRIPGVRVRPTPGTVYTVRYGDNLSLIAARFGTSVSAIVAANGIFNPSLIYPGQRLVIPSGVTTAPLTTYVVRRGDTLSRIAARLRTSVTALIIANNLRHPSLIFPGQVLVIPRPGVVIVREIPTSEPPTPPPPVTATWTPTPTRTTTPVPTATPTRTPTPTITPTPTPTRTPTVSPTPTPTRTPFPTPVGGYSYILAEPPVDDDTHGLCNVGSIFGWVRDLDGVGLPGVRVRTYTQPGQNDETTTTKSGVLLPSDAGYYDRIINPNTPATWIVVVVDDAGNPLSVGASVQYSGLPHCHKRVNWLKVK